MLVVKNPPVNAGDIRDIGSLPGSGRSPGGRNGNPLQYFRCAFKALSFNRGASQVALVVKNPPVNAGDVRDAGLIPGLGRSSGGENGNLLQHSCWENPMDSGACGLQLMGSQELGMTG